MKVGDLVMSNEQNDFDVGLVLEMTINMWGEEAVPSGVRVLWRSGEIEVSSEDELMLISELKEQVTYLRE